MNDPEQLPSGMPDFVDIEEERPRRLRWVLGFLALALAVAVLVTALTRVLMPRQVSWGTGFLLGGGYVLTCEHVVRDGSRIAVHWEGRVYEAEVVASSGAHDLALLKGEALGAEGLPWNRWKALGPGDIVVAVGYPAGSAQPVTVVGEVLWAGTDVLNSKARSLENLLQVHGAYQGGMSGAPVLNVWGEVVGVVSGSVDQERGMGVGLAVPGFSAYRWLASTGVDLTLEEAGGEERLGISGATDSARAALVRLEVPVRRLDGAEGSP